jgi:hypothetical protein
MMETTTRAVVLQAETEKQSRRIPHGVRQLVCRLLDYSSDTLGGWKDIQERYKQQNER